VAAATWEAVSDAAGVGRGTSILDLGCGDGAFCAFAAHRGAIVHGVDVEPDSIARALETVPGADFRMGLMESLPWIDASFDVVTSFNAVQYALDPEVALIEAARVVRPDGRIAICKWGPPKYNEFFAFLTSIEAGGIRDHRLPVPDPVEMAIRATRLEVLTTGDVSAPIEMADDAALDAALTRAGIVADHGATASTASETAAAVPYRDADGGYRFDNRLRYWVLGRRR